MHFSTPVVFTLAAMASHAYAFSANIVAIGASITYGVGTSKGNGYRDDIKRILEDNGNTVQMLGSQKGGDMNPDPFSEGYPGFTISGVTGKVKASFDKLQKTPNVAVMLVGTNDFNDSNRKDDATAKDAPKRLGDLIDYVQEKCKDCVIVISSLPPNGKDSMQKDITGPGGYNDSIKELVEKRNKDGQHILFSDGTTGYTAKDLVDGTHPNDIYSAEIGKRIADKIMEAGKQNWIKEVEKRSEKEGKVAIKYVA